MTPAPPEILVVEADPGLTTTYARLIASYDHAVVATDLAEEALDFIKMIPFSACLLTTSPPDMCGFEALKRFRDARPLLPILFCGSDWNGRVRRRALRLGATETLPMPFSVRTFADKLEAILEYH